MPMKERGTPERGIDRMLNEGGGGSALHDLIDHHLDEETPQNNDVLLEDQLPEDTDGLDDTKKSVKAG